jgi:hypothetical protein
MSTQVDLANQAKGVLPAANVTGLVQALIDIGTLQGDVSNLQESSGDFTGFMSGLDTIANLLGYAGFPAMMSIFVYQIEANRVASGAAPVAGYIPPP